MTPWRIQDDFPAEVSDTLLCDSSKNIAVTIVSMTEYQHMRNDVQVSRQNPSDNRYFFYANAARTKTWQL